MPMKRGFQEVVRWKQESDERKRIRDAGYVPQFMLGDGEEVEDLWFNGTEDEPGIVQMHTKSFGGRKFRSVVHREQDCVACYLQKTGDKSISGIQEKGVFLVADPRLVHKIHDDERSSADREKFKYIPCDGDDCKLCRKNKPERSGQKRWELSMTWVYSIMGRHDKLRGMCACGGRIKRVSGKDGESILCSKCSKPNPLSMFRVPFSVQRNGTQKSTSYNFGYGAYQPVPSWVEDLDPPNLDDLYPEPSIQQQCRILECENPFEAFSKKKAASSYDDAEEEGSEGDIFG